MFNRSQHYVTSVFCGKNEIRKTFWRINSSIQYLCRHKQPTWTGHNVNLSKIVSKESFRRKSPCSLSHVSKTNLSWNLEGNINSVFYYFILWRRKRRPSVTNVFWSKKDHWGGKNSMNTNHQIFKHLKGCVDSQKYIKS